MRNRVATILLFLSWPVCVIHRIWNSEPLREVSWIRYDRSVSQDFRWYWVYNELWLSALFVLVAFTISKGKTMAMTILLRALMIMSVVDIVHYWLWFRRNEYVLTLEGLIMIASTAIIVKKTWNKPSR